MNNTALGGFLQWTVFLLLTAIVALGMSWWLWAQVDFAYPWLHDHAGIAENITQYAPHNTLRPQFDTTSTTERIRLFHGIVVAIHQHGQGLAELTYHDGTGQPLNTLLTPPEVLHLQDVANLIDKLRNIVLVAFGCWGVLLAVLWHQRTALPSVKQLCAGIGAVGVLCVVVLSLGAVNVFYQLHEWIFPAGHQWFFYYEQSLMSMMMKAPDLFGYIALMLAGSAGLISIVILWGYQHLTKPRILPSA